MMLRLIMMVKDEAQTIKATLESVKGVVDSWCILDTGSSDGTQGIVRDIMRGVPGQLHEEAFVPYLDMEIIDFAATRNRLLDLASPGAEYLLTLDGGDTLRDADTLKELLANVPQKTHSVQMEINGWPRWDLPKIIWAPAGQRYKQPVHEALSGDCGQRLPRVWILHEMDPLNRRAVRWWNDTKILTRYIEENPGDPRPVHYLAQTWCCLGNHAIAAQLYEKRGAMTGWPEETWLALHSAGFCHERAGHAWGQAIECYLKAFSARPRRADSLFAIAQHYHAAGDRTLTRMFAEKCLEIPMPKDESLPMNREIHTWHARALLGNINPVLAKPAGRKLKFSLVHPTRGRAAQATKVYLEWSKRASGEHEIEYIVSIDADDPESMDALWPHAQVVVVGDSKGSVDAYNRGWEKATGDVIVQLQDDVAPPDGWDKEIAARIGDVSQPKILQVNDGRGNTRPWLLTIFIATQAYLKKCGYMYHPDYRHSYGDDDHSLKGLFANCIIDGTDLVFKHDWQGTEADETAKRNYGGDSMLEGHEVFKRRAEAGFPDLVK